jgi:hypothetical protein
MTIPISGKKWMFLDALQSKIANFGQLPLKGNPKLSEALPMLRIARAGGFYPKYAREAGNREVYSY